MDPIPLSALQANVVADPAVASADIPATAGAARAVFAGAPVDTAAATDIAAASDVAQAPFAGAAADTAGAVDSAGDLYRLACRVRRQCGFYDLRSDRRFWP